MHVARDASSADVLLHHHRTRLVQLSDSYSRALARTYGRCAVVHTDCDTKSIPNSDLFMGTIVYSLLWTALLELFTKSGS